MQLGRHGGHRLPRERAEDPDRRQDRHVERRARTPGSSAARPTTRSACGSATTTTARWAQARPAARRRCRCSSTSMKAMNQPGEGVPAAGARRRGKIDRETGLLAPEGAPKGTTLTEVFVEGTEPTEVAPKPGERRDRGAQQTEREYGLIAVALRGRGRVIAGAVHALAALRRAPDDVPAAARRRACAARSTRDRGAHAPKLVPPMPVDGARGSRSQLGSLDLGAPLVALAGGGSRRRRQGRALRRDRARGHRDRRSRGKKLERARPRRVRRASRRVPAPRDVVGDRGRRRRRARRRVVGVRAGAARRAGKGKRSSAQPGDAGLPRLPGRARAARAGPQLLRRSRRAALRRALPRRARRRATARRCASARSCR